MPTTISGSTGVSKVQDGVVDANALATLTKPLGVGQTLQNVAGSRSAGVTYTNTTGRPIWVTVGQTSFTGRSLTVDGLLVSTNSGDTSNQQAIVPSGSTYSVNAAVTYWVELR